MGSNRKTVLLSALVAVLAVVCIGLAIALGITLQSESDSSNDNSTTTTGQITTVTTMASTFVPTEPWEKDYRLPEDTLPIHYEILLHPDLETGLFTGTVDIHVNVTAQREFLLVHTKYLSITTTKVYKGHGTTGEEVAVKQAFEYQPNEFWVIMLSNAISAGSYTISLVFNGSLTKDIVGFYRSSYFNDKTNQTRLIATSKFEPTYARLAFPCLDEPSFKSTFSVSLVRPTDDGYMALSNMPEESHEDGVPRAGLTTVKFEKSVPMVTYLACFIVCDFGYIENTTAGNVPFRVLARPNQMQATEYPLKAGVGVNDFYEQYFGIKYVLPKQDLIAIPDFVSGAMEHWGLVTFRETALLFDPRESSSANQKRVLTVVAHELAHQWFGNLMTIKWWDDLWLNEGFASYMEYKGSAAVEPDWDMETQMIVDDVQPVLKLDAKLSSHPIVQPVRHPDEITEIFDTISYSKGASVLRMLENFMGNEKFQLGIQRFLEKYKFANAVTADLWNELKSVTPDLDIPRIMDTWTRQMGYPVLNLRLSQSGNEYIVTQQRFVLDTKKGKADDSSPFGYKWDVPIQYVTDSNPTPELVWMKLEDSNVTIPIPAGAKWVKLNAGQYGFYRVNYLPEDWTKLSQALLNKHDDLTPGDRSGLMNDAFSLAESEALPYATALDMILYLKKDRHPVPWTTASDNLKYMYNLLYSTSVHQGFRKLIVGLVEEAFNELGWEDTGSFSEKSLRTTVLDLACMSDYAPCLDGAVEKLNSWLSDSSFYLPPNIRSLVYRYGMSAIGGANAWDSMWKRYLAETNPQEQIKLLYGLAFTKESWILNQYLEYAKNDSYVRSQDYFTVLEYISYNPIGLPIVWDFVRTEWEYLVNRFSLNNRYLGRMVGTVTSQFSTELRLQEMEDFFAKYPEAGAGARARQQALETVRNNIRWLSTNQNEVRDWLEKNSFA